mmetsp:Transcript_123987/g.185336  ORF Transcript_123987/g.185336 Transcript_123987/m.185336 type:complete len:92 (-) Transcript_123987:128-403(-)
MCLDILAIRSICFDRVLDSGSSTLLESSSLDTNVGSLKLLWESANFLLFAARVSSLICSDMPSAICANTDVATSEARLPIWSQELMASLKL